MLEKTSCVFACHILDLDFISDVEVQHPEKVTDISKFLELVLLCPTSQNETIS